MDNTTTVATDPDPAPELESHSDASAATVDQPSTEAPSKPKRRWFSPRPRPGRGHIRLLLGGLALSMVGCAILAAVFGWKLKDRDDDTEAGHQALAAAKQYAVTLTSIDANRIDQDLAAVTDGATGDFKDMYTKSAVQLKPLLVQAKSVSKGQVIDASVESASTHQVVVMLFVDSAITNVTNPTPRVDRNRIVMTMDNVGGRWLASKVDLP